jgi:hypothetical protein
MIEYKKDLTIRLPVRLQAVTGDPVTNVANTEVTVTVEKADGTLVDFFPSAGQWIQVVQGAFNAAGKYTLILPASYCDQAGPLTYCVAVSSARQYFGVVKLVVNEEVDTKVTVDEIRADYTTARAGKIDTIASDTGSLAAGLQEILEYQVGKWEIQVTGPDANRLILYRPDGVTVLKKFDLQNANGDPTFINPFKRIPV